MLLPILRGGRTPSWSTLACGLVCAAVAGFVTGPAGGVAALVGAGAVLGFFWTAQVPLRLAPFDFPGVALALLLLTYTLRLVAVVAILRVASGPAVIGGHARILGSTVIACAMVWSASEVLAAVTSRTFYVDVDLPDPIGAAPDAAAYGRDASPRR